MQVVACVPLVVLEFWCVSSRLPLASEMRSLMLCMTRVCESRRRSRHHPLMLQRWKSLNG